MTIGFLAINIGSIWDKAWPIFVAILFFGLVITVHEFGHFIFAKLFHVKVHKFAIGMGPKLFGFQKGETQYSLRALPIGGYVIMEGEDEDSSDENALSKKPIWQRAIITAAGAIFNLIIGLIFISILLSQQDLIGTKTIADFADDAVSVEYGLQREDTIKRINGLKILTDRDISYSMMRVDEAVFDITVERDGKEVLLQGVEFETRTSEYGSYVYFDFILYGEEPTFFGVVGHSIVETLSIARLVRLSIIDLISGNYGLNEISGPVGTIDIIADAATDAASGKGFETILTIMAFISINIGIFNLLPVPALDGGRLFFFLIEAIRRKPIPPKYEGFVHAGGLILLLGLMAVVTINDIFGIIRG